MSNQANVSIDDPTNLTLSQIHELLTDISMSNQFELLSRTDQKLIGDLATRLRTRLNRAGMKTWLDHVGE